MKAFFASWGLAAGLLVPSAIVLVAVELLHAVPSAPTPRLLLVRRVLMVVGGVLLVAVAVAIVARFHYLRT
jgi:hypothetical protein